MSPREDIARQFRFAMQLGSCDPRDCQLCDCNMDDEGRAQIESLAYQQADVAVSAVVEACIAAVEALPHTLECVSLDDRYNRPCNCLRGDLLDAIEEVKP